MEENTGGADLLFFCWVTSCPQVYNLKKSKGDRISGSHQLTLQVVGHGKRLKGLSVWLMVEDSIHRLVRRKRENEGQSAPGE